MTHAKASMRSSKNARRNGNAGQEGMAWYRGTPTVRATRTWAANARSLQKASPTPGMRDPIKKGNAHTRRQEGSLFAGPSVFPIPGRALARDAANLTAFVTLSSPRTRYAAVVLLVALIASLAVAAFRARTESHARRLELAMDYADLDALARSYDYNTAGFLVALRRAGLTSLAVTEELGANVGLNGKASATTGAELLNGANWRRCAIPYSESSRPRERSTRAACISSSTIRLRIVATGSNSCCISNRAACAFSARPALGLSKFERRRTISTASVWAFRPTRSSWHIAWHCWWYPDSRTTNAFRRLRSARCSTTSCATTRKFQPSSFSV